MDLDQLRKISSEGQNDIANKILQKCNPQKIAQELVSELQTNANNAAKKGEHEASASFLIWVKSRIGSFRTFEGFIKYAEVTTSGPLVSFPDQYQASKLLFNMVKKYVTDNNIQLELEDRDYVRDGSFDGEKGDFLIGNSIIAKVKW